MDKAYINTYVLILFFSYKLNLQQYKLELQGILKRSTQHTTNHAYLENDGLYFYKVSIQDEGNSLDQVLIV